MKLSQILCSQCGMDLTRTMRMYDREANVYCYDCWDRRKQALKARRKAKPKSDEQIIMEYYRDGWKVSEIATETGYSAKEIYEVLTSYDRR